jgi:hypothetical protein
VTVLDFVQGFSAFLHAFPPVAQPLPAVPVVAQVARARRVSAHNEEVAGDLSRFGLVAQPLLPVLNIACHRPDMWVN